MTETASPGRAPGALGRIAAKATPKALHLRAFAPAITAPFPPASKFWNKRKKFEPGSWGNTNEGCCTIAKQVNMFRRFERLELRQTVKVTEEEVHRVYRSMTADLYGGGDTGAYEDDALSRSRRPETCLLTTTGRHLLIDAYLRLDPTDHEQFKQAMWMAAGKGLAVCLNLPTAFQSTLPPDDWDVPKGSEGEYAYRPGGWGGHSMWAFDYDTYGIWLEHTWNLQPQRVTWKAASMYMDEAHVVIDKVDDWRKAPVPKELKLNVGDVIDAVNAVSSQKIAA